MSFIDHRFIFPSCASWVGSDTCKLHMNLELIQLIKVTMHFIPLVGGSFLHLWPLQITSELLGSYIHRPSSCSTVKGKGG